MNKDYRYINNNIIENIMMFLLMASVVFISVLSGWKSGALALVIAIVINFIMFSLNNHLRNKTPAVFKIYYFLTTLHILSIFYAINVVFALDIVLKMVATSVSVSICFKYIKSIIQLKRVLNYFLICSLALSLYNAYYFIPNIFRELPFGGPNPVALLMFISIVFVILYTFLGSKKWLWFLPVFVYVLFLTESQKSILSFIIIFFIYIFLLVKYYKNSAFLKYLLSGVLLMMLSFYILTNNTNLENSLTRTSATIESIFSGTKVEGAAGGIDGEGLRSVLKQRGWEYFTNQPFVGYGTNNFRALHERDFNINTYTHFTPLELILNIGFIGFFLYYTIYYLILKNLFRKVMKGRDTIYAFLFSSVIASIIIGFYMQTYADTSIHLLLLFSLLTSNLIQFQQQKNIINEKRK